MDGVYAAVATPIGADGRLSRGTFDRLVEFLIDSGVAGICVGGATSEYPNVEIGIKDSSGIPGNLVRYASARDGHPWTLLVGHDRLLYEGLNAGWNGAVSGIAGFCPELPLAIYRSFLSGDLPLAARLQGLLDEAVTEIRTLPTPWGIRLGLAARGFDMGSLPLPVSAARREQLERFQTWVGDWLRRAITT